ncbi:MAG: RodZ domain-containing protein [Alphaproteobacteria bacterium]
MRQARLDKNDDLYLIADYLRIKPAFLIALENSQYDEFPADAYVIGFLRTYANFLGVDGKDAVDRYRYEMAGRRKKPVLSMPTPVSGGRTPSAVIMVGATIAVLLIYAVWYSISSANRTEVNVQPPLPTVAQSATTTSSSDSNAAAGLTAPLAPATTTTNSPASTAPSVAAPNMPPVAPGIVVTTEQPQPTSLLPETKDAKKQVYGDSATVSRLLIRATQSSWVMVSDDSGKAIFDHVMKAGDVYKVPNKPGLSLTTGNGGALVLSLDGVELPKISEGAPHVVRNIPLDPDRLAPGASNQDR